MKNFLCVFFLFAFTPACDMAGDDGSLGSDQDPVGDLQLNNKTTWTVIDVATGAPDNDKFCVMELAPGASMTLNKIYAPDHPRTLAVTFKDADGTVAVKDYQVTLVPNAVTVVGLEGLSGCEGYAPPSGTATVSDS